MPTGRRAMLMGLAKAGFLVGGVSVGATRLGDAPRPLGWDDWSKLVAFWLAASVAFCWAEARMAAWRRRDR